jgi:hypothetical protein
MVYNKKMVKKHYCNICDRKFIDLYIHEKNNRRHKRLLEEKQKEFYRNAFNLNNLKIVI